ncbi:MAG TPA: hypothetical protein VJU82_12145, partial [Acidobacteriaceae bacterium]|nr:hypothetical protein [Acidobacteriaceae bacterium]
ITDCQLGQAILDRHWWQRLERPLKWRLHSFHGKHSAEFYTIQWPDGSWDGLATVTGLMHDSIAHAVSLN